MSKREKKTIAIDDTHSEPTKSRESALNRALAEMTYDQQVQTLKPSMPVQPPPVDLGTASVQRKAGQERADQPAAVAVQRTAGEGVSGSGAPLPHLSAIQASFGQHDVSSVEAHVGGKAAEAATAIGAEAYATGNAVAFRESPSLATAAHEAAHVVQQRAGVSLEGGVGKSGDTYERNADAAASAVTQGRSAEALLGPADSAVSTEAVQRTDLESDEEKGGVGFFGANSYAEYKPFLLELMGKLGVNVWQLGSPSYFLNDRHPDLDYLNIIIHAQRELFTLSGDQVLAITIEYGESWHPSFRKSIQEHYEKLAFVEPLKAAISKRSDDLLLLVQNLGDLEKLLDTVESLDSGEVAWMKAKLKAVPGIAHAVSGGGDKLRILLYSQIKTLESLKDHTAFIDMLDTNMLIDLVLAQDAIRDINKKHYTWSIADADVPSGVKGGRRAWSYSAIKFLSLGRFYWFRRWLSPFSLEHNGFRTLLGARSREELSAFLKMYDEGPIDYGPNMWNATQAGAMSGQTKEAWLSDFTTFFTGYREKFIAKYTADFEAQTGEDLAGAYRNASAFEKSELRDFAKEKRREGGAAGEKAKDYLAAEKTLRKYGNMTYDELKTRFRNRAKLLLDLSGSRLKSYRKFHEDTVFFIRWVADELPKEIIPKFKAIRSTAFDVWFRSGKVETFEELLAMMKEVDELEALVDGGFKATAKWRQETVSDMETAIAVAKVVRTVSIGTLAAMSGGAAAWAVNAGASVTTEFANQVILDGKIDVEKLVTKGATSLLSAGLKFGVGKALPFEASGNILEDFLGKAVHGLAVSMIVKPTTAFLIELYAGNLKGEPPDEVLFAAFVKGFAAAKGEFTPEGITARLVSSGADQVVNARLKAFMASRLTNSENEDYKLRKAMLGLAKAIPPAAIKEFGKQQR